jgi:type I restriction enzyme, R subunit
VDSDSSVTGNPEHGEDPDLVHWAKAIRIQVKHPCWTVVWLARIGEYRAYASFRPKSGGLYVNAPDSELNRSRRVSGFHTPAALAEMVTRDLDTEIAALAAVPQNLRLRPYQVEANSAVEQAIRERKRKMLLAMATGTGKTLTMVNEAYRLMKSGVARRVLFLVDRRALAAQAVRAFASFEAEPGLKFDKIYPVYSQRFQKSDLDEGDKWDPNVMPNALLTSPKLGDAFVYVCTIQRMAINLLGGEGAITIGDETIDVDAEQLNVPIHAFDLIIADECHRGYSAKDMSVWRTTLDHFDAIKVGLTATPAAHTMAYFENLAYRYEYDRAVREGHLVDYDVVRVRSNVRMDGIFLNEGEQIDQVDPETGTRQLDLLEDERAFDATEVERKITAPDSNRKILEELKAYADEHEREYGRFPKTLIFAANDLPHTSHADQLVDLARDIFGKGDSFAAKITGRVDRPLQPELTVVCRLLYFAAVQAAKLDPWHDRTVSTWTSTAGRPGSYSVPVCGLGERRAKRAQDARRDLACL